MMRDEMIWANRKTMDIQRQQYMTRRKRLDTVLIRAQRCVISGFESGLMTLVLFPRRISTWAWKTIMEPNVQKQTMSVISPKNYDTRNYRRPVQMKSKLF